MEKIRVFQKADTDRVMQLWLEGNCDAHGFIPQEYLTSHYEMVREQLAQAELFVYESAGKILGFVGVMDGYIAGIFIDRAHRSQGLGAQLLRYLKARFPALTLGVYQKNRAAVAFYLREGFTIEETGLDEDTGEPDCTMSWHRNAPTVTKLREHPELAKQASVWFHEKWGVPLEAYEESIRQCSDAPGGIPQWYGIWNQKNALVTGAGVIENDFHDRPDLTPNLCALYVEEGYRRQGLARALLDFIKSDMGSMGVHKLYLVTDHTDFYEKCGWTFLTIVNDTEGTPERMYEIDC